VQTIQSKDACRCSPPGPSVVVNGVRIDALTPGAALLQVERMIDCSGSHVVNHLSAHPTVVARRDFSFRRILNRADLNLADGIGIVWACRLQGVQGMRQRVYGPDFLLDVAKWSQGRDVSHAFIGGTRDTPPLVVESLRRRFPDLNVTFAHAPPFREVTAISVKEDLDRIEGDPDILWVGLGTPKQQLWADLARGMNPARVILTVGAAFDFISGAKRQAPRWIRDRGFEWAFRFATEPRRLWRRAIVDNASFTWHVSADLAQGLRAQRHR
jgi:N-acetylglucosaminyldiphosphoundecaprenol N-acetyl-beta-D-mannosaminyltransferase